MRKNRHEVWWEQAEWALTRYFNKSLDDDEREAAGRVVRVLLSSELATSAEVDFLREATHAMSGEVDLTRDYMGEAGAGLESHIGDRPEEGEL